MNEWWKDTDVGMDQDQEALHGGKGYSLRRWNQKSRRGWIVGPFFNKEDTAHNEQYEVKVFSHDSIHEDEPVKEERGELTFNFKGKVRVEVGEDKDSLDTLEISPGEYLCVKPGMYVRFIEVLKAPWTGFTVKSAKKDNDERSKEENS